MSLCDACTDRGMCCRDLTLPVRTDELHAVMELARPLTPDELRWVLLHHGVAATANYFSFQDGTPVRLIAGQPGTRTLQAGYSLRIDVPCSALKDGFCTLFGTDARPQMCSAWPNQPEQIQELEGCAYAEIFSLRGSGVGVMPR